MSAGLRPILFRLALLSGLLNPVSGVSGASQEFQAHAEIQEQARQFLLQQVVMDGVRPEVAVNSPDGRLRLPRCPRPLEVFLPPSANKQGRVTVGVRCTGAVAWSLYLPAQVKLFAEVAVARQDLSRGVLLTEQDIVWEHRDVASLPRGYILEPKQILGKRLQRPLRRGAVLVPTLLEDPRLVKRGDLVYIVAQIGGIEARMQGKALAQGSLGERIRVLSLSSGKELDARVISAATVRVDI